MEQSDINKSVMLNKGNEKHNDDKEYYIVKKMAFSSKDDYNNSASHAYQKNIIYIIQKQFLIKKNNVLSILKVKTTTIQIRRQFYFQ